MPSFSAVGDGVQVKYGLPPHAGLVTATVNAANAPITSQDALQVTLSAAPAYGTAVVITFNSGANAAQVASALPRDAAGNAIQALAPDATVNVAIGVASAAAALPAGAQIVRVASNAKCFVKFGLVGLVAAGTDLMFPSGAELFTVPAGATHVAVIQDGAVTGSLNVTRMV